jgi:hypothetical protein
MRRAKDLVARICPAFPLLLGLWILALSPSRAHAEADTLGVITGSVVSAEDGFAIQNAGVIVSGMASGVGTNRAGQFRIDRVSLGAQTLKVLIIGRETVNRKITVLPGENKVGTIALEYQAVRIVYGGGDTVGPFRPPLRVRLSVTTPELIRVLAGTPLTPKQPPRDQFIGTLQGRREDDVVIRASGTELAIPVRSVSLLEASLGTRGNAGRGALIGLGAGMVGGIAAALIVCNGGNCESSGLDGEPGIVATVLGAGGAIAGCGVGALTGALIRTERWRTIPVQDLPYGDGLRPESGIRLGLNLPLK